jgi:hypothetical protein
MNGVKSEDDAIIKPDPENGSPGVFADDDDFEDTGELQFPRDIPQGWLTRVPRDLWAGLKDLKDDDEINIGNVLLWTMPDGAQKVCSSPNKCWTRC